MPVRGNGFQILSLTDLMKVVDAPQSMTMVGIGSSPLNWKVDSINTVTGIVVIEDESESIGFVGTLADLRQTAINMCFAVGNVERTYKEGGLGG